MQKKKLNICQVSLLGNVRIIKENKNFRAGILTGVSAVMMMAFASVIMNSIVAKSNGDVAISLWIVWVRLLPGIIVPLAIVWLGGYFGELRDALSKIKDNELMKTTDLERSLYNENEGL